MNYSMISYTLGRIIKVCGVLMLLPICVGIYYKEKAAIWIAIVAVSLITVGSLIALKKPQKKKKIRPKEGFIITGLTWIIMSLVGSLPFYLSGEIPSFTDAVFETASGFTTTGSSILTDIESMSKCLLFWRSFTHWIGGMGILVFLMILLPSSADEMNIMKAESPGPSVDKMVPKAKDTAFLLYAIYAVLTVICIVLLIISGMPKFDAVCLGFGTAGTGGFGVLGDSCESYSATSQVIITVFMLLFGVNFNAYFILVSRKFKKLATCEEVRWYFIIYACAVVLVMIGIAPNYDSFSTSLREATFQVASVMTTTGFATTDFNLWNTIPKVAMVAVMFVGACAGSTGGGMKVSRWVLYFKQVGREMSRYIHPRSVRHVKIDGKVVDEETIRKANVYLMAYVFVFIFSFLIICLENYDIVSSFTSVAATLNNIGPGLGVVGPVENFQHFSILSKWTFIFDMIAGRLEIFPILILFAPATWRKK